MKKIFPYMVLAVLASISSAFACPNLVGTFNCPARQDYPASISQVSQRVENGVTIYTIKTADATGTTVSGDYIADGAVHSVPIDSTGTLAPESYTCEGDISVRMDSTYSEASIGQITLLGRFGLDGAGNMHSVMDATYGSLGPQHDEHTCVRQ